MIYGFNDKKEKVETFGKSAFSVISITSDTFNINANARKKVTITFQNTGGATLAAIRSLYLVGDTGSTINNNIVIKGFRKRADATNVIEVFLLNHAATEYNGVQLAAEGLFIRGLG
jgi:hypothetical protein